MKTVPPVTDNPPDPLVNLAEELILQLDALVVLLEKYAELLKQRRQEAMVRVEFVNKDGDKEVKHLTLAEAVDKISSDVDNDPDAVKQDLGRYRQTLAAIEAQAAASGPSSVYAGRVQTLRAKLATIDPSFIENRLAVAPPGNIPDPSNPSPVVQVGTLAGQPAAANVDLPGAGSDEPAPGSDAPARAVAMTQAPEGTPAAQAPAPDNSGMQPTTPEETKAPPADAPPPADPNKPPAPASADQPPPVSK